MSTADLPAAPSDINEGGEDERHSVLLIHGQPDSAQIWNRVRPLLLTLRLRVVSIDRRSPHLTGRALDRFAHAAAIAEDLDERPTRPMIAVGHSVDAGTAIALAAAVPHHVQALVLVAPAVGRGTITGMDRALAAPILGPALSWLGFRTAHIPALRRRLFTDRLGLSSTVTRVPVRRITRGNGWRDFTAEQRHLIADAERLEQCLHRISCPVVVVAGLRDRMAPLDLVAAITDRLPQRKLITTDCGHLIPVDDPDAVVDAVLHALRWTYRTWLHRIHA